MSAAVAAHGKTFDAMAERLINVHGMIRDTRRVATMCSAVITT